MSRKIWWAGIFGFAISLTAWILNSKESSTQPRPGPLPPTVPAPPASFHPADAVPVLIEAGWSRPAAESVVSLNAPYFTALNQDDPAAWKNTLARLRQLGRHAGLMELLERHPELAGLLAGAVDPVAVAAPLYDVRNYDALAGMYARHASNVDALAIALGHHKPVMLRLQEAGFPGAEAVFLYPRTGQAAAAYGRWLDDLLGRAVRRDENELIAALGVVLSQGTAIRRRMEDDLEFRRTFYEDIWPRFERLVDRGHLTWEQAAWDNHLFDLLALPEGEALVAKWGLLPSDILFGPDRYPRPLHSRLIAAMQNGDNDTLHALLRFGHLNGFQDCSIGRD